uniref:ComEC/Rec2 family competence protein n=1 Tax=Lysobacter firmicutimachus TaxID=1792846 RepID=UPI003F4E2339
MFDAARTPPFGKRVAIGVLAGIGAGLALPRVCPWGWSIALAALAVALWWRRPGWRWPAALAFGFAWAGVHAAWALSLQLPPDWEKREVALRGRIVELPLHEPRRSRFDFRVDDDAAQPAPLRGRLLRLSWYDEDPQPRSALRAGQRWQLRVRLRAPRGLRNPGAPDAERYALMDRLSATGYLRRVDEARRLSEASGLQAWRETLSDRIAAAVPTGGARFVRALALGDTRGLDPRDWSVLRANGLTHLIAISGFHVGLVAGAAAWLARALWWLWPGWGRRCPAATAAAVAAMLGAGAYAAAVGFALPTVRTWLMIAVVAGLSLSRRGWRGFDALAVAAIALALVDPLALLGAGFWLSFLGVLWLMWCLPADTADSGWRARLGGLLGAQGVSSLGLLPVAALLFGQASLAGPLANLLAVPWWSLLVVPLALLGTGLELLYAGAGAPLWRAAAACFEPGWPLFEALADSGLALWWLPEPHWYALPLALAGAFWLLLPRGTPGKALAVLLWLPLLWPDRQLPRRGEVELVVVDVGQGLSVLVRTAGHSLLYDAGPAVRDGFDAGERAVLPSLRALGVRQLDRVVASHGDNDHAGGLGAVLAEFPAPLTAPPEVSGEAMRGLRSAACRAGQRWDWDGVRLRFLHPSADFPYLGNESSCVLRIDSAHGSALLTGDIGEVIERDLVRRAAESADERLRADVVLVAHHGSGGSSDPAFVAATGARHALISAGHGNRFGHPRKPVLQRWREAGARTWLTAGQGAVRVRLGAGGIAVETRRQTHPRLWDATRRTDPGLSYRPD